MKKIYLILMILLASLAVVSCQQDELDSNVGYLRIKVSTNTYVDTKIAETYNPKQIAVQITNSQGTVVEDTDDWTTLNGSQIRLSPGTYTISASSNGFDGSESGFDIPYYAGSTEVTITAGKEVTADITCTLANVKVTVNYDTSFSKFAAAKATVTSALEGVAALEFAMGDELAPGYFPVGDLSVTIDVTNNAGDAYSQTTSISGVAARKHYILNFKVADSGSITQPTVTVDGEEIVYDFTFNVSTEATTKLEAETANAWSNFAYLEGKVLASEGELDNTAMRFEYKKADTETWTTAAASYDEATSTYKNTLTGLSPATTYSYRLCYEKDGSSYSSDAVTFTTENATVLPNGSMEDWYQDSNGVWYATSESEYNSTGSFWDSGNPATILMNKNPTQSSTNVRSGSTGTTSAELKSQFVGILTIGKFAAGNLYIGSFNSTVGMSGAILDFGKEFDSRPSSLKGWFNYTNGTIDYHGDNTPTGKGEEGTDDLCSIYVALSKTIKTIDNTDTTTFIDFETDTDIIAYGVLSDADAVSTNGSWASFEIPFTYKDVTPQDTYYLIAVFSASKYGDYFTGSTSSVMYVDDLELVYGIPTVE